MWGPMWKFDLVADDVIEILSQILMFVEHFRHTDFKSQKLQSLSKEKNKLFVGLVGFRGARITAAFCKRIEPS